jgi:hypothetical protein
VESISPAGFGAPPDVDNLVVQIVVDAATPTTDQSAAESNASYGDEKGPLEMVAAATSTQLTKGLLPVHNEQVGSEIARAGARRLGARGVEIRPATKRERVESSSNRAGNVTIESVRSRLRTAVEESGMTQEQIGVKMGLNKSVARSAVCQILNAQPSRDLRLSTILALCKALNRRVTDFF